MSQNDIEVRAIEAAKAEFKRMKIAAIEDLKEELSQSRSENLLFKIEREMANFKQELASLPTQLASALDEYKAKMRVTDDVGQFAKDLAAAREEIAQLTIRATAAEQAVELMQKSIPADSNAELRVARAEAAEKAANEALAKERLRCDGLMLNHSAPDALAAMPVDMLDGLSLQVITRDGNNDIRNVKLVRQKH